MSLLALLRLYYAHLAVPQASQFHVLNYLFQEMIPTPLYPRDSQEFSPASQFGSINSSVHSLPYGPTLTSTRTIRKTTTLTIWTFVSKVVSLLFNMLSRFVIVFLPRSNSLLISWLQSPPTMILEPKKIKSVTVSTFPLSIYLPWNDGTRCHDLSFLNYEF